MTYADRMKEIEAREKAATEGPWMLDKDGTCDVLGKEIWGPKETWPDCPFVKRSGRYDADMNPVPSEMFSVWPVIVPNPGILTGEYDDAAIPTLEFIAHARADVPFLLSRVEELEAALGEAMLTMRDDTDVINRLTAIKEGRHE